MHISVQDWGGNFDRLADELLAKIQEVASQDYFRSSSAHCWQPSVNVYEAADQFLVCAELPGVDRGQIEVQFEDGVLHIGGNRPKPTFKNAPPQLSVVLMEIDSGPFRRSLEIRFSVDVDHIRAWYRNGYLWIKLPRLSPSESED